MSRRSRCLGTVASRAANAGPAGAPSSSETPDSGASDADDMVAATAPSQAAGGQDEGTDTPGAQRTAATLGSSSGDLDFNLDFEILCAVCVSVLYLYTCVLFFFFLIKFGTRGYTFVYPGTSTLLPIVLYTGISYRNFVILF